MHPHTQDVRPRGTSCALLYRRSLQKARTGCISVFMSIVHRAAWTAAAAAAAAESLLLKTRCCCCLQDIALIDARRGATMFRNVRVPILGIIENMSYYQCPSCGHQQHIFGRDGAKRTAEDFSMELLGQVPLVSLACWPSSGVQRHYGHSSAALDIKLSDDSQRGECLSCVITHETCNGTSSRDLPQEGVCMCRSPWR